MMINIFKSVITKNWLTESKRSIKTVAVIGSGLMGSGIAQVSAESGFKVSLVDVTDDLLKAGRGKIEFNLKKSASKKMPGNQAEQDKFIKDTMNLIQITTKVDEAASKADLVIEAIIENIEKKHQLFRLLDAVAQPSCIFASNTSSLSISEIASCTKRTDKFGGLHFFNPVPIMGLVEIITTPSTSDITLKAMIEFTRKLGKTSVQCRDTPGFIVNRLLVPYLAEATRMLERGDASAEDIDNAMKLGAGHPMGPFTLADYVGLDTTKFILDGWHQKFPNNPLFAPIPLLNRLIEDNKFGLKSGEGFYNYKNKKQAKNKV